MRERCVRLSVAMLQQWQPAFFTLVIMRKTKGNNENCKKKLTQEEKKQTGKNKKINNLKEKNKIRN